MAFGGLNSAAAELTPEPRHHKEFRAELDTVAHLCLLHSKESFGRTFDGQASPSFVSSVCATQCQQRLFWVLLGSAQALDEGGAVTLLSMLPKEL